MGRRVTKTRMASVQQVLPVLFGVLLGFCVPRLWRAPPRSEEVELVPLLPSHTKNVHAASRGVVYYLATRGTWNNEWKARYGQGQQQVCGCVGWFTCSCPRPPQMRLLSMRRVCVCGLLLLMNVVCVQYVGGGKHNLVDSTEMLVPVLPGILPLGYPLPSWRVRLHMHSFPTILQTMGER